MAKQDRVVVGVQLPGSEEPPTTVQSDTPRYGVSENPPECTAVRACAEQHRAAP